MMMWSSNRDVSPYILSQIMTLLRHSSEIRLDKLCESLGYTRLDIPWGVDAPFFIDFRKDGHHWIVRK